MGISPLHSRSFCKVGHSGDLAVLKLQVPQTYVGRL